MSNANQNGRTHQPNSQRRLADANWSKLVRKIKPDAPQSNRPTKPMTQPQLWFDGVSQADLDSVYGRSQYVAPSASASSTPISQLLGSYSSNDPSKLGKYIAMDCEMVGVGPEGVRSALARVTIVNFHGRVVLDKYVRCREKVTDYRSAVSGITAEILRSKGQDFLAVQKEVADLIKDRIVIGHALENDFQALLLHHPRRLMRDTSRCKMFRKICSQGRTPSLRKLCSDLLQIEIQTGAHSSVEDAQAVLLLYKKFRNELEAEASRKGGQHR